MILTTGTFERELSIAVDAALDAGAAVRDFYDRSTAATYTKGDGSPVTDADLASDRIIRAHLRDAFPDDAILTEEGVDDVSRLDNSRCWIVDPIDGTQQFIDRTGEFDVLMALVIDGRPAVAVLYQPTEDRALVATQGGGAWILRGEYRERVQFERVAETRRARLFTSTYFGAPDALPLLERVTQRANAEISRVSPYGVTTRDLLPDVNRFDVLVGIDVPLKATMAWEWDFAASDLFVHEAGGRFTNLWGEVHTYNKRNPRNFGGLVMSVDPGTHARILSALTPELPASPPTPG